MLYIIATARPIIMSKKGDDPRPASRTKLRSKDVERAIQQASNLCFNFEDTPACKVAWDHVEELSAEYARQRDETHRRDRVEADERDPLETREYDV